MYGQCASTQSQTLFWLSYNDDADQQRRPTANPASESDGSRGWGRQGGQGKGVDDDDDDDEEDDTNGDEDDTNGDDDDTNGDDDEDNDDDDDLEFAGMICKGCLVVDKDWEWWQW